MKPINGYFLIKPEELAWRPSNLMKIPNADFLERTRNSRRAIVEVSAEKREYASQTSESREILFCYRRHGPNGIDDETVTVPKHGGVLVGPKLLRQAFKDTDEEVLWLIIGAPEKEFDEGEPQDMKVYYSVDPKQPKELDGIIWPPAESL